MELMADLFPSSTTEQADEKTDHSSRICPIVYDIVDKEADVSLNPNYFDGFNWNYSPAFSYKNFDISSSMGPEHYAFDASYNFQEVVLFKGIVTHDRLTASVIAPIMSKQLFMISLFDLREARLYDTLLGFDYVTPNNRAQVHLWGTGLIRATYIKRVTPRLYLAGRVSSSGGHFFWTREPQETSVGYAARYETDKMVASAKAESSGDVLMTYVHKISKKVSLATDFVYNCFSRDVKASVGYDYNSRLSRVQGKIDSDGVVSAHLQRQLNEGLRCILSATLDLKNMAHRLGLRLTYG
ncbi:PREDICTED: mitochondrial import receptor subunit TOM40-1-like [Camelina sativa]|uniref:Mitochondrial import receptor subunit TOM40-1-like n=1 Tax=Camelina sativa TaxID=90675 RepID=A0ABM0X4D4_CAMSA|nr:PREDICTED: mitochondrial import receptor subunit TOM40-1-like [Camelina sativa]